MSDILEYTISQKKEVYNKLLRVYDSTNYYKPDTELNYDYLRFIDEFRIIELFISLLDSFDIAKDVSNSIEMLEQEIERWNNDHPTNQVDKEYLFNKYYLVSEGERVIVNPEVIHGNTSIYVIDKTYIEFVNSFFKYNFYYPLFNEDKLKVIFKEHNKRFKTRITEELIRGENKDFHSVIFHNDRGLRDAFLEALKIKLSRETYESWRLNLEYYFNLLMEINASEIDISSVIRSMDKNKKKALADFSFDKLMQCNYKIDDLNFLYRLKYVPYEIQGENIVKPNEDSRLIAYDSNYYDNLNMFDRLEQINRNFGNFEFNGYYSRLVKEAPFILRNFRDIFTTEQLEDIPEEKFTDGFIYYFSEHILSKTSKLLDFKSLQIAPLVIEKIYGINVPFNERNGNAIFSDEFKIELLQFYLDYISEKNAAHFNIMLDLYFYLSRQQIMSNNNINLINNFKNKVIDELLQYMNEDIYRNLLLERLEAYSLSDNLYLYDLLVRINNKELRDIFTVLIIKNYLKVLSSEKFYSHYYDLKGVENLLRSIDNVRTNEIYKNKLFIDFINCFTPMGTHTHNIDWSKYFSESRKLRFHLGVLCLVIKDYGWDTNLVEYVLDTYKHIKVLDFGGHNPLSWEEIVQDTFRIPGNSILKNEEIITCHIVELLKEKDNRYITDYIKVIKDNLSYFEIILLNKSLRDDINIENEPVTNIENISRGMALSNAYFLLNNGCPVESLLYINYAERISSDKRIRIHDSDYLNLLKYYCYINTKEFKKAIEVADQIQDKSKSIPRVATAHYFIKNYNRSKQLFESYFKNYEPDIEAIVNYSAVLISMDKTQEAIKWCEKYIDQYKDDYLLNANLACAYNNTDNVKALYYFNEAKRQNPKYEPAIYGTVENINSIINEIPTVLDSLEELDKKGSLTKAFTENSQKAIKILSKLNISEYEIRILKDINKAIQLASEKPINIEKLNENELSDMLKDHLKMSLDHYGYEVTRESPQGYATSNPGELDFFIFKSGEDYINIATGENKVWSQDKFKKQLGQLFGYLREYGGFGFTIIFNKEVKLENVLRDRETILENICFEDEEGNKIFEKVNLSIDMECYDPTLKGVLLTSHKNPELDDSVVRVYHFVLNVYRQERKDLARIARKK